LQLAPAGISEMVTLTDALPITFVVIKFERTDLAHHLQDETAIGTGDRYDGHC